jgi:DNA polymerase
MEAPNIKSLVLAYLQFLKKQPAGFMYTDNTPFINKFSNESNKTPAIPDNKNSLQIIKDKIHQCAQCPLSNLGRSTVVFGEGNPHAQLMFIGEGPGRDEDEQGRPFVGRAGQLLTKIIQAMKLEREDVYISNVVKCRPPNNRVPLPTESDVCKNLILFTEIDIIQPKVICTLGATATQALLGNDIKITQARGIFSSFKGIPVLPTYHPAYLLRNPDAKKIVWEDMKKIMAKLQD